MRSIICLLVLLSFGIKLQAQIRQLEYGWDTDKGHGLNTLTSVTGAGANADVNLTIPMQGLTNGYHLLYIRTRDSKGIWSQTYLRLVNVRAGTVPAKIVRVEYAYTRSGTQVGQYSYTLPNPATSVQLTVPGDVSQLTAGQTYVLSIWATDENGTRSQVYQQTFTYRAVDCKNLAVSVPATAAFCKNGSTLITGNTSGGNAPVTVSWSRAGTDLGRTTSLTVAQAGSYSLKATDAQGCASSATVNVTEAPSPTVTVSNGVSLCAGQTATLTASAAGGTSPYTYQWKQGTTGIGSAADAVTITAGGTYSVAATDANGCSSTAVTTTVTQRLAPVATITASAPGFITGGTVTLTANSGSGLAYQWLRDGQPIAGATQVNYTVQQPGSYAVVVSNGECSATSAALVINLITALEEPTGDNGFSVSVSPNPGADLVEVRLDKQPGKSITVLLTVSDLTGRRLYQKTIRFSSSHYEPIDLSRQVSGVYLLNATSDKQQTTLRLIKE